jgi:hypothetical protein
MEVVHPSWGTLVVFLSDHSRLCCDSMVWTNFNAARYRIPVGSRVQINARTDRAHKPYTRTRSSSIMRVKNEIMRRYSSWLGKERELVLDNRNLSADDHILS